MLKTNELLKLATLIGMEVCYLIWGAFLVLYLPILNYLAPAPISLLGIKFSASLYAVVVGLLYLLSAVFMARRRPVCFKLALAANIIGLPLLVPIVLGLISIVIFNRPEIKEQFKK